MTKAVAQERPAAALPSTPSRRVHGFGDDEALNDQQREGILRASDGAMGSGEDIGAAVVSCVEEAGYVPGQTLHVNGGMAMP